MQERTNERTFCMLENARRRCVVLTARRRRHRLHTPPESQRTTQQRHPTTVPPGTRTRPRMRSCTVVPKSPPLHLVSLPRKLQCHQTRQRLPRWDRQQLASRWPQYWHLTIREISPSSPRANHLHTSRRNRWYAVLAPTSAHRSSRCCQPMQARGQTQACCRLSTLSHPPTSPCGYEQSSRPVCRQSGCHCRSRQD